MKIIMITPLITPVQKVTGQMMECCRRDRKKLLMYHTPYKTRPVLPLHYSYIYTSVIILLSLNWKSVTSEPSPIMAFPPDSGGSYSLFPDEDLRTGKKIRFDDDLNRDRGRDRTPYRSDLNRYRSYPIMFEDRLHRPGDYNYRPGEQRPFVDPLRNRGPRVFFDDDRLDRNRYSPSPYDDRYAPYPNDPNRFRDYQEPPYQQRPFHHHYRPDVSPGPSLSKLPVGAGDSDVRIHVYDPVSNSFGNPRNSGRFPGDRSRPGNFIETGGPSPELFLNHDQYLEYHRKIAIARELEFRKLQKSLKGQNANEAPGSQKVLFSAKQPFDITGLSPPDKTPGGVDISGISMKPVDVDDIGTKGQIVTFTGQDGRVNLIGVKDTSSSDNKDPEEEVRSGNLKQYENTSGNANSEPSGGTGTEPVTKSLKSATGTITSVNGHDGKGEELESENANSQVTQIPPQRQQHQPKNFISKSGRQIVSYKLPGANFNITQVTTGRGNVNDGDKGDENNGPRNSRAEGTDFQLTSGVPLGQESSSSNIGGGQALPLIQASFQKGFVPNVPQFRSISGAEAGAVPRATNPLGGPKGEKSELGTEVTKSRIKSNTAGKVAIIKQQELKQRQKLKQQTSDSNSPTIAQSFASTNTKPQKSNHNHDQLTKTKTSDTQSPSLSRPSPSLSEPNFRIPVLPVATDTESKLDSLYLDNNDILGPTPNDLKDNYNNIEDRFSPKPQDEGPFTLVNLNNDQVDILDPHDDDSHVSLDQPQTKPSHLRPSGPMSSSSSDSDLDHGDGLIYLGTNDAIINKTFKPPALLAKPPPSARVLLNNPSASSHYIKVVRVKSSQAHANFKTTLAATNNPADPGAAATSKFNLTAPTEDKTLSLFMAKRMDLKAKKNNNISTNYTASSLLNHNWTKAFKSNVIKMHNTLTESKPPGEQNGRNTNGTAANGIAASVVLSPSAVKTAKPVGASLTSTHQMSMTKGVIAKVHAHVSHCPKLQAPAEIICDIHIRDSHGHPNPQLTVGWRRKFYNATQPDVLLVLNKTQVYEDDDDDGGGEKNGKDTLNGTTTTTNVTNTSRSSPVGDGTESAKSESLEDFHDKFNVTLAPGISPMLRSVLLIRGVAAPDTGNYQCEVSDGIYTLTSETLLFLCH